MKEIYVIKDVSIDKYYWTYRTEDGFDNIENATQFDSEEDARKTLRTDYLSDLFSGRIIEIKKLYKFN